MADLDDDIPLTDDELALAQRGKALIAAAMAQPETRAPQALRESLERARTAAAPSSRRQPLWRRALAPGLALSAVAVVALVVALGGSGDGSTPPSVLQVASVTRLPAKEAAPAAVAGTLRLSVAVEGLAFPDWSATFHWKATGRRDDRVGGREVTTVAYSDRHQATLGYAIVAGTPLKSTPGHDVTRSNGRYRVLTRDGRTTVTWTKAGHTCVIDASSTVPVSRLVTLAAGTYT